MTKVEFIKLKKAEKAKYLCELADEFFQAGKRVLITIVDENQGITLDKYMWTWQKISFIPHAYDKGILDVNEPVIISICERNPNGAKVLIMGNPCSLDFIRTFERVIDFAEIYDDQLAESARRRYAQYREAGFETAMRQ
jgi:DNA polymerase-3 subunit chi